MLKLENIIKDTKKVKLFSQPISLFEFWENLKEIRCPICGLKLRQLQKRDLYVCKNKKVRCRFRISRLKLLEKMGFTKPK